MTNFGTMRYKHIISVVLWSMFLVACGPDRRVALAEKLMAEKETDSAIAVMQEIKEPQNNLTDRDYALYALLLSEAMHRKQQLNAETDTLLLPAIKYFSESGDSLYAERALYCKAHLDRRLYRMKDAMQSFLKALLFLQGSGNDEQLYRVNTWLGVVCLNQEEYEGKMRYPACSESNSRWRYRTTPGSCKTDCPSSTPPSTPLWNSASCPHTLFCCVLRNWRTA